MPNGLLVWLFPLGVLVAVVLAALVPLTVAIAILSVAGFVGVPLAWREWDDNRTRLGLSDGRRRRW